MRMENLGLFKGYPKQVLTDREQDAQFDKNQLNHPSTRPDGLDLYRTPTPLPSEKSTPKKPG